MKYPMLNSMEQTRESIEVFKGLNRNLRIGEGEFGDMNNLCSDRFPVMTPRDKRKIVPYKNTVDFLFMNNYLWRIVYTAGASAAYLYRNNTKIMEVDYDALLDYGGMLYFGSYIILGNGQYVNTENTEDRGNINVRNINYGGAEVTCILCREDGSIYENVTSSGTEPSSPADGAYWVDTSGEVAVLKQWSASASMWVTIPTTYVKIACAGIGANLSKYDGVTINTGGTQAWLDGSHILWDAGDDYLVVTGIIDETVTFTKIMEVERKMPKLSYWFESGNRLWGVSGNEIRASKLGDFRNWDCYMGLSTDSYAVSVGSQGGFTGGINYQGYPTFWKSDRVYRVYGSYPAEFQVKDAACQGVAPLMHRSLAVVNQTLFYMGADGVYAYDGASPVKTSYALGDTTGLKEAVGTAMGNKYVMAALAPEEEWEDETRRVNLYIYDTETGLWHREYAGESVPVMESLGSGAIYLENFSDTLWWMGGSAHTVTWEYSGEEEPVEWFGETGILGMTMPDRKYISRVLVRLAMDAGSVARFYIQYDSKGPWELMDTIRSPLLKTMTVPMRPHRCDHFRMRIEGSGAVEVYSITKTLEQGSDQ